MALSGLSGGDFMRQKWRLYEPNDTLPCFSAANVALHLPPPMTEDLRLAPTRAVG